MFGKSKFVCELESYEKFARKFAASAETTAEQKEASKAALAAVETLLKAIEDAQPSLDKFDELCG